MGPGRNVAFTALQRASTTSSNYLTEGFLAHTRNEEIKAPGYRAMMVIDISDVTLEILEAAKDIKDPMEKEKKINAKISGRSLISAMSLPKKIPREN